MALRFSCPCGQKLKTQEDTVGKKAKCPKCEKWLRIPRSFSYDTVADVVPPKEREPKVPAPVPASAPSQQPDTPKNGAGKKGRVVVADSIPEDLSRTVSVLRDHNYEVIEAASGDEALDLTRKVRPDAVILNVKLAGMSGFQVIQQLRNPANALNKDIWDVPILMTTEKLHGRDKQYAMSLGVDGYFVKPAAPAQLCSRLEKAISKYRLR